jgi:hypothetical protein
LQGVAASRVSRAFTLIELLRYRSWAGLGLGGDHVAPDRADDGVFGEQFLLNIEVSANMTVRLIIVNNFLCPSDRVEPSWPAVDRDILTGAPKREICRVAPSNYVGMNGTSEPGPDGEGVLFRNSRVAFRDITDGLSQTIAVGERSHLLGVATWSGAVTGALLYDDRTWASPPATAVK